MTALRATVNTHLYLLSGHSMASDPRTNAKRRTQVRKPVLMSERASRTLVKKCHDGRAMLILPLPRVRPVARQRNQHTCPLLPLLQITTRFMHVLQAQLDSERASYELARRLQAQEEASLQEHRRLVQEASRVKSFDCVICMENYTVEFSAPIRSCGHALCRTCMKEHVQSQVAQSVWPIRCPTCVADHSRTEAHGVITRDLVETLGIDEAVMTRWVKLEMDKVSIAIECPSCRNTAAVDPVDFREAKELTCPLGCGAHWCKQCNITFERGGLHSCDGQAEMDHLLGQKDWKKCPACQVPVEKTQGCNHMTCRCHCHFCYICGGEITRSTHRRDIDRELQAHYQRDCKLFEYPDPL